MILLELVTWNDINVGDNVWSMGGICEITKGPFRNEDNYDMHLREGIFRFTHRDAKGNEFSPPMELDRNVPRVLKVAFTTIKDHSPV